MRLRHLLGLAACASTVAVAAFSVIPTANAAQAPCNLTSSGNSASARCYSGSQIRWQLVVDCYRAGDRSGIPTGTLRGAVHIGDGSDTLSCASGERASGRLQLG